MALHRIATCDYRKRLDVTGVTVLLDVRAVNRLFLTLKFSLATTSAYGPSGVVACRRLGPEVDPFILNCSRACRKEAGDDCSTKAALAAAKVRGTLRRPGNPNATLDTLASPADDVCHH